MGFYTESALRYNFCSMRQKRFCGARTRRGTPCQCKAIETKRGAWRCRLHGGLSTGAQTPEGLARVSAAARARWARYRAAAPANREETGTGDFLRTTRERAGASWGATMDTGSVQKRGPRRPYTPELAHRIYHRLSEGESLRSICRDADMPSTSTVLAWVAKRPDFQRSYDLGRENGREAIGDEVLDIADNVWRRNSPTAIEDARREIDAKKWQLARMTSKRRKPRVAWA